MKDSEIEWQLPDELAQFLRDRCQKHLSEKDLEPFLDVPVPSNVDRTVQLDAFMKAWLEQIAT